MKLVWSFSDTPAPANAVVGGKGFSLVKMSQAGLAVPPGFVLSVDFFNPWISTLEQTTAWRDLARAQQAVDPDAALAASCAALKTAGADLALSAEQQQVIELAFFEGLSHGAISKRLDQPLGTTKTRIRTGIRRLAEQLQTLETAR